jgi:hypothetical protein
VAPAREKIVDHYEGSLSLCVVLCILTDPQDVHNSPITAIYFLPDEPVMISSGEDNALKVCRMELLLLFLSLTCTTVPLLDMFL